MCGIFGVYKVSNAARWIYTGLHGLQHRAVDYAGIVSSDGHHLFRKTGAGTVRQVFTKKVLAQLLGTSAIGHIRYPTVSDKPEYDNTQPIGGYWQGMEFALAHNGNLTNADELRTAFDLSCTTKMDSEVIVRMLEISKGDDFTRALVSVLRELQGSFSLVILLPDQLIAVRDPQGNRPLSIGSAGGTSLVSSETCPFPNLDARYLRDIEAGTIVTIDERGTCTTRYAEPKLRQCRFEAIYFSHPSSVVFGDNVANFRMSVGRELERLFPVEGGADIVTPIPDSAMFVAMGYGESRRSGAYYPVIMRSHYVGRTFIAATQEMREEEVDQKFTFSAADIADKRVVVLDDSIVRGTTLRNVIARLRSLGARAVHVRVGAPPITHPCRYGINTRTERELLSSTLKPEGIRKHVAADSLEFLPLEVLKRMSGNPDSFCWSCMTGEYW
jgi:amidophosphoribosyltransferase